MALKDSSLVFPLLLLSWSQVLAAVPSLWASIFVWLIPPTLPQPAAYMLLFLGLSHCRLPHSSPLTPCHLGVLCPVLIFTNSLSTFRPHPILKLFPSSKFCSEPPDTNGQVVTQPLRYPVGLSFIFYLPILPISYAHQCLVPIPEPACPTSPSCCYVAVLVRDRMIEWTQVKVI